MNCFVLLLLLIIFINLGLGREVLTNTDVSFCKESFFFTHWGKILLFLCPSPTKIVHMWRTSYDFLDELGYFGDCSENNMEECGIMVNGTLSDQWVND